MFTKCAIIPVLGLLPSIVIGVDCNYPLLSEIQDNKGNKTALNDLEAPSWVPPIDFRGTFSILQSCILTLVACVYTALHLNVPYKADWWRIAYAKLTWTLTAIVVPEIVLSSALKQFIDALTLRNQLHKKGRDCTLGYAYFIVMGGLQIRVSSLSVSTLKTIEMGGDWERFFQSLGLGRGNYDPGHWADISVPETLIKDKSKTGTLEKILVVLQVTWMAATCITRKTIGLPLTLLEIHTMVHVLFALATYIFWFQKPLDIHDGEMIEDVAHWEPLQQMMTETFRSKSNTQSFAVLQGSEWPPQEGNNEDISRDKLGRLAYYTEDGKINYREVITFSFMTMIFGGVHLTAWNYAFPTDVEAILWKVACLVNMGSTSAIWLCNFLKLRAKTIRGGRILQFLLEAITVTIEVSACLLRHSIVVESFISLRRTPIGAYYVPAWLQVLPHV